MQSSTFSVKQKEEEHVLNQSVILNYLLNSKPPPLIFPSSENLTPRETTILTIYQNPISLVSHLTYNNIHAIIKKGEK